MSAFNKQKKTGFTLIEILLYMALTVTMVSLLGRVGVFVLENRTRALAQEEMQYGAQFAFEIMKRAIHNAQGEPVIDNEGSRLTLSMVDAAQHPTVFELYEGRILQSQGGGEAEAITPQAVAITELSFTNAAYDGTSPVIRIVMTAGSYGSGLLQALESEYLFSTTIHSNQ